MVDDISPEDVEIAVKETRLLLVEAWFPSCRPCKDLEPILPELEEIYAENSNLRALTSGTGESAVVHYVQSDLASFSDGTGESDDDPAVVRTVEPFSVVGSDTPVLKQEKEARSSGGIPSR